jgi:hypothetical protein
MQQPEAVRVRIVGEVKPEPEVQHVRIVADPNPKPKPEPQLVTTNRLP